MIVLESLTILQFSASDSRIMLADLDGTTCSITGETGSIFGNKAIDFWVLLRENSTVLLGSGTEGFDEGLVLLTSDDKIHHVSLDNVNVNQSETGTRVSTDTEFMTAPATVATDRVAAVFPIIRHGRELLGQLDFFFLGATHIHGRHLHTDRSISVQVKAG